MKIQKFDQENLHTLRAKLKEVLSEVEKETGVKFMLGSMTYSSNQVTSKLTGVLADADDKDVGLSAQEIKYKQDWNRLGFKYECPNSTPGDVRSDKTKKFTLLGAKARAKKFPIMCKNNQGVIVGMTVAYWNSLKPSKS